MGIVRQVVKKYNWDDKCYVKVIELKTLLDYKLLEEVMRINHLQMVCF